MLLIELMMLVRVNLTQCYVLSLCPSNLNFISSMLEFAFEIGSSLLTEVRRLQSLLGERDKAIQNMKEERDDLEKGVESLRTALRTQEVNAGMYTMSWISFKWS